MKVSREVLAVLEGCRVEGEGPTERLFLPPGQLDRALYVQVDKVLTALGGKWHRGARAHVFDGSPADALDRVLLTGEVARPQDFGFFETPDHLAARLADLALEGVRAVQPRALEPSAGRGRIVRALRARGAQVDCCELLPENVAVLRRLGDAQPAGGLVSVVQGDFFHAEPEPVYDVVAMNPPFARGAAVDHVVHALRFLRPGGRLVAVVPTSIQWRTDRRHAGFLELVDEREGQIIPLPEKTFAESGTDVRTCLVVLQG